MNADADLAIRGQARLIAEFLERLDLRDVTLVFNDWSAAQVLISEGGIERVGRLVLSSCEAFANYPPGLPGRAIAIAAKLPGGLNAALQPLRLRFMRRLPMTFGWMSKRPIPHDVMDGWLRPVLTDRDIRRDLLKYVREIESKEKLLEWAEEQRSFDRPVLVAWAAEDRVMPLEHGRRLADLFPRGRLVEIPDSYTLIPEDQPAMLAAQIRESSHQKSPLRRSRFQRCRRGRGVPATRLEAVSRPRTGRRPAPIPVRRRSIRSGR